MSRGARRLSAAAFGALLLLAAGQAGAQDARQRRAALERYRAGQALMRAESWEKAEAEFREAIRLDPLLVVAHYDLGQALMALKRFREAVVAIQACRRAFHDAVARSAGDQEQAEQERQDQIRVLRDEKRALENTLRSPPPGAQVRGTQQRVRGIEMQIDSLTRLRFEEREKVETPPGISLALGSAYFRSGQAVEAEREYQAALRVDPKFGEAHNNLAVLYMLSGNVEEAQRHLKEAERCGFPVNPGLRQELEQRRQR